MKNKTSLPFVANRATAWTAACISLWLAGCGGDSGGAAGSTQTAQITSAVTTLELAPAALPADFSAASAAPTFHVAPVILPEPDNRDAVDASATAQSVPRIQGISPRRMRQATSRLTPLAIENLDSAAASEATGGNVAPMASSGTVTTYSPAQIRAAYGLPALPSSWTSLTAAQAAQYGAGQTIYIVDAMSDPNVVPELAAFNAKFGLPACTTVTITASAPLPLGAPSSSTCQFSVVYSTSGGGMTTTAPSYDSGWATEIALDVQWAHATAPLARIVLIEAPSASLNDLLGAVNLANAMGPGVVSMSFGAAEGSYTASVDGAFAAADMTYLAATGDAGAGVSWPAVSTRVVAVGGTTLTYSGGGSRSEVGWSNTGGGISAYTATPSYQSAAVPGMGSVAGRMVADVAFNADPYTGQYIATQSPGTTAVTWLSAGGTSLSTPQWAGLIAIANAIRAQGGKSMLGAPHAAIYGQIATVPGTYAANFADVTQGSDGTCATCNATIGYDQLTGLGTPNVNALLNALAGVTPPAPVVTSASVSGTAGQALTFNISAVSPDPLAYALIGAPSGMTVGSTGLVSWPSPVAGQYTVTATVTDTATGLSGSGTYTVTIAAQQPPLVSGGSISATTGIPLSFTVGVTTANPVTFALSGAPAGMSINSTGTVTWPSPVAGSYSVTVVVKDTKTGLTGQGVYSIKVTAPTTAPTITASPIIGRAGVPVSGRIVISDPGATSISVSIAGVPAGMVFQVSGTTITVSWPKPVRGSYSLKISLIDNANRTAQATMPVTIR